MGVKDSLEIWVFYKTLPKAYSQAVGDLWMSCTHPQGLTFHCITQWGCRPLECPVVVCLGSDFYIQIMCNPARGSGLAAIQTLDINRGNSTASYTSTVGSTLIMKLGSLNKDRTEERKITRQGTFLIEGA